MNALTDRGANLRDVEKLSFIPFRNDFSERDMESLVAKTLEKISKMIDPPTALICEADMYALSFLRQAPDFSINIPERLSIIGFNNTNKASEARPQLTSLNQPMEMMGTTAVNMLLERIETPHLATRMIRCSLNLVERESVISIRKGESV